MSQEKPSRDDVLRQMLKTPPVRHKPIGKRKKADDDALIEQIEKDPDKLNDLGGIRAGRSE